jgi:hypothetical protein
VNALRLSRRLSQRVQTSVMGTLTALDTDNDGTIDAKEFMVGCKGGLIRTAH